MINNYLKLNIYSIIFYLFFIYLFKLGFFNFFSGSGQAVSFLPIIITLFLSFVSYNIYVSSKISKEIDSRNIFLKLIYYNLYFYILIFIIFSDFLSNIFYYPFIKGFIILSLISLIILFIFYLFIKK